MVEFTQAPIQPRNLQIQWSEGNVSLNKTRRSTLCVPDYNAIVKLEERGSTDITDVTNEFFEEIERNED